VSTAADAAPGRVLVLNCGSSSVKYQLFVVPGPGHDRLDDGDDGHDGGHDGLDGLDGGQVLAEGVVERVTDHAAALDDVLHRLRAAPGLDDLLAVGHRVVHGGERFSAPTIVDDAVLRAVDELAGLAPLHNPACATGVRAARKLLPDVPHVAVFDTAFHRDLPARARTYAVPADWRERLGVRRYGFHGTSHAYVSRRTAALLGRPPQDVSMVVLHLGNGASACAVDGGRSVDTSMGMTPLAGLVMGTRSGDVDPALTEYLNRVAGLGPADVDEQLNQAGGLLALAGASDVREVTARAGQGDASAQLALDVYCYRIRCYVGAYYAALGRLDAIAFTAGVGENSALVRARSLAGLERLGIAVDEARNARHPGPGGGERVISPDGAPVTVLVVPTDEEREIARQTAEVVLRTKHRDRPAVDG
jgi:acetate kinase